MRNKFGRKLHKLLFCRRGVNQVISSVIMASAVITLGFMVLLYTQQETLEHNTEYSDNTDNNIAKIQEKLVFEHIHYNNSINELTVFLLNCGKTDGVTIDRVYLSNDSWSQSFDNIELKFLDNTATSSLDATEEGFFQLTIWLQEDTSYIAKLVTARGRYFAETFIA